MARSRRKIAEETPDQVEGENMLTIENYGPIELLKVPFVPGRISVAYGSNGTGKSESQDAFNLLSGLKKGAKLRDGAESGLVEGFGAKVTFTAKRCNRTGQIMVDIVEEGFSLARFARPGFADADANDRQRIRDLSAVLKVEIKPEDVWQLVGGYEEERAALEGLGDEERAERLAEIVKREKKIYNAIASEKTINAKDPASYVAALKADCDRVALANEKEVVALKAEIRTLEASLPEGEYVVQDRDKLLQAVTDAMNAKQELQRRTDSAADAEKLAKDAEALLKIGQGQSPSDAKAIVDDLDQQIADSDAMIKEAEEALRQERIRLGQLQEKRQTAADAHQAAIERESEIQAARDALQTKHSKPSPEEWDAAEKAIAAAQSAVTRNGEYVKAETTKGQIQEKKTEAAEIEREAESLRAAAKKTLSLLVDPINAMGCGITINEEMRLIYVDHPERENCPVDDLSAGEMCSLIIDLIVMITKGKEAIVSLPQEMLEGLDPINLKRFIDKVATTQLMPYVAKATAKETDGELSRQSVFGCLVEHWKDLKG